MQQPEFVVLLLGPRKSGKTAFLKHLGLKADDSIRTTECSIYDGIWHGKTLKIIDTPGLDDSPNVNLAVLRKIAEKLVEISSTPVNGVIYFHYITDFRLTGSAQTNIKILECICGKDFRDRIAFVTTMWNRINPKAIPKHDKGHQDLGQRYRDLVNSDSFFKFSNNSASAQQVLRRFLEIMPATPGKPLQFEDEVRRLGPKASGVRKTEAGKLIAGDMGRGLCTIL